MKFIIDQDIFLNAVYKGALAALSDDAQGDTTNAGVIVKSLKIDVSEEKMILESVCKSISSRYVLNFDKNVKICQEAGCILISAKDLVDWLKIQPGSKIKMSFDKFESPKSIIPIGSENDENVSKISVMQTGTVDIVSLDAAKTGSKWTFDCYDQSHFNKVDFDSVLGDVTTRVFNADVKQLQGAVKSISFAIAPKDSAHVFNSIKFQKHDSSVYIGATDKTQCALYKLDASDINFDSKKEGLLIVEKFLSSILDLSSLDEKMSFHYDKNSHKVFIAQKDFYVRVSIANLKEEDKFTSLSVLLNKKYVEYCKLNRKSLMSRLLTSSLVNKKHAEFSFKSTDKGNILRIYAVSESGKAPSTSTLNVISMTGDKTIKLGVQCLASALTNIKDEDIVISSPINDENSIKIISDIDKNLQYYLITLVINGK